MGDGQAVAGVGGAEEVEELAARGSVKGEGKRLERRLTSRGERGQALPKAKEDSRGKQG